MSYKYTQSLYEDLVVLMGQLSQRCVFDQMKLMLVPKDPNSYLYIIEDNDHIIGCATLCLFYLRTGTKGSLEDVVVSDQYRGQHLGKRLMEFVLEEAKKLSPIELHLTSNPMRVAANKLYQSLGFQKNETNTSQLEL